MYGPKAMVPIASVPEIPQSKKYFVQSWVKEFKKWLPNRNLRVYHVDQNSKISVSLIIYGVFTQNYHIYLPTSWPSFWGELQLEKIITRQNESLDT